MKEKKDTHPISKAELKDWYDEEYFEGGKSPPRSNYTFYARGYSELEEGTKEHYTTQLGTANKYMKQYVNIFDGQGKKALEIGCAYAYGLRVLRQFDYAIYGVDISEYAIKRARDYLGDLGNVAVSDAEQLPFKDSSFDLILGFGVLEHLPFPELMISECYRLLKPGGLFIAKTNNRISPYCEIFSRLRFSDRTHINVRGPQNWGKAFRRYNWKRATELG